MATFKTITIGAKGTNKTLKLGAWTGLPNTYRIPNKQNGLQLVKAASSKKLARKPASSKLASAMKKMARKIA